MSDQDNFDCTTILLIVLLLFFFEGQIYVSTRVGSMVVFVMDDHDGKAWITSEIMFKSSIQV